MSHTVTIPVSVKARRHEELCETCWTGAIVTVTTTYITASGVTTRPDRTYCVRCRKDQAE